MTTIHSHKLFYQQQQNENSLVVENKFNPITCTNHVHLGTKLKVLIHFFKEMSNSLYHSLFLIFFIKKPNKSNNLWSSTSFEYIFLWIEIKYSIIEYIFL